MINRFSKVVIISVVPLSQKVYEDFYLEIFKKNKFEIEFWDISGIFYKSTSLNEFEDVNKRFYDKSILRNCIREVDSNTLLIVNVTYVYKFMSIYRMLRNTQASTAFFARGMLPISSTDNKRKNRFILIYKMLNPARIVKNSKFALALLFKNFGFTKTIDFIFQAGTEGVKTIGVGYSIDLIKAKRVININYFDYDNYLIAKSNENKYNEDYIVFLDEFLPFHPDFELLKMQKVEAEDYFIELNRTFDRIESITNLKIVIACHPKSTYSQNYFGGREMIKGDTMRLVYQSKFVIAHNSTSISMAVCAEKQVYLLDSELFKSLNSGYLSNLILAFSSTLGLQIINMSSNIEKLTLKKTIDLNRYSEYKHLYLSSIETQYTHTADIIDRLISFESLP